MGTYSSSCCVVVEMHQSSRNFLIGRCRDAVEIMLPLIEKSLRVAHSVIDVIAARSPFPSLNGPDSVHARIACTRREVSTGAGLCDLVYGDGRRQCVYK